MKRYCLLGGSGLLESCFLCLLVLLTKSPQAKGNTKANQAKPKAEPKQKQSNTNTTQSNPKATQTKQKAIPGQTRSKPTQTQSRTTANQTQAKPKPTVTHKVSPKELDPKPHVLWNALQSVLACVEIYNEKVLLARGFRATGILFFVPTCFAN